MIHEVKKSDKMESAHEWQVRYYILILERNGIEGVTGLLEYPKLRHTLEVLLSDRDRNELEQVISKAQEIIARESCPERIKLGICKNCSYFEFCWVEESESI